MSDRCSLNHRYFQCLRRIWLAPSLAAILLSLGAFAAQPTSGRNLTVPAAAAAQPSPDAGDELEYSRIPRLLPTELNLAPEFRSACAPVLTLPPSLVLDEKQEIVDALEPIASCLRLGPLARERLHLVGSSELPGRWDAPVEGSAPQLRSSLSLLGLRLESQNIKQSGTNLGPATCWQRRDERPERGAVDNSNPFGLDYTRGGNAVGFGQRDLPS